MPRTERFVTYVLDNGAAYISSALGLAELNRDYPLFPEGSDEDLVCKNLLAIKETLNKKLEPWTNKREAPPHFPEMETYFIELGNVHARCMVRIENFTNSNVPDFWKNKSIYIITGPETFQEILIRD